MHSCKTYALLCFCYQRTNPSHFLRAATKLSIYGLMCSSVSIHRQMKTNFVACSPKLVLSNRHTLHQLVETQKAREMTQQIKFLHTYQGVSITTTHFSNSATTYWWTSSTFKWYHKRNYIYYIF